MRQAVSIVIIAAVTAGCSGSGSAPAPHATPATVEHPRTEAELSTVKLTPEAVKRLGIETVTVKTETAAATRTLGGEVVVPEGRGVVVTAPVAGTLTGAEAPLSGARVRRGDRLMTIAPLVPAERDQRIEAQRAITAAEAEELAARQRLQRLEQLLKDGAASVRSVEEGRAQHQVTVAALTAARERLAGASTNPVGAQGELIVSAPFDGVIQRIAAVPGQTVAASAPLLELAQIDTLWVRVPVYAGDAGSIDQRQRVTVRRLGNREAPITATRVTAPLQGNPSAASVDLYYAIAINTAALRPGERVLVELPLTSTERGLVVPDKAVLYDIHGAAWVYEDLGGNAYTRRRIEVARHAGDRAVVRRGLTEGMKVVIAGTAELFGTEFGAGH
jgi:membrane fusion protein, heavy metal efflux system